MSATKTGHQSDQSFITVPYISLFSDSHFLSSAKCSISAYWVNSLSRLFLFLFTALHFLTPFSPLLQLFARSHFSKCSTISPSRLKVRQFQRCVSYSSNTHLLEIALFNITFIFPFQFQ